MQNILKVNYGFNSYNVGSVTVYTGKIRIKADAAEVRHFLQNWDQLTIYSSREGYTTIEYSVIDFLNSQRLMNAINEEIRRITINRINAKYDAKQNRNVVAWKDVNPDDLPF